MFRTTISLLQTERHAYKRYNNKIKQHLKANKAPYSTLGFLGSLFLVYEHDHVLDAHMKLKQSAIFSH